MLRTVEERGIRFIRLWFTDILGFLKSFAITPAELETAFEEGVRFDGSAIDGFSRNHEADMLARPDPTTFQILPWHHDDSGVARMFCDIVTPDGEPFPGDPRCVLRRNLQRAPDLGFSFYVGPEIEYFYFEDAGPEPKVLDRGGYFDLTPLDVAQEYRRSTIVSLEQLGIPVEFSHHEVSPSQHELDLRHTDALSMADNIITTRLAVKEVAMEHGIYATFMPKPLDAVRRFRAPPAPVACSRVTQNAFHEDGSEYGLSKVGPRVSSPVCSATRARSPPSPTSGSTRTSGWSAGSTLRSTRRGAATTSPPSFGSRRRRRARSTSTRIEYRSPDPACNPYLAFSVILAAGLAGIENNYELPRRWATASCA